MKPQVLQFLLDLVEDHTDASSSAANCESTSSDDDCCVGDATSNDDHKPARHRVSNGAASPGFDQPSAAASECAAEDSRVRPGRGKTEERRPSAETGSADGAARVSDQESDVETTPSDAASSGRDGARRFAEKMNGELSGDRSVATRSKDERGENYCRSAAAGSECQLTPTVDSNCQRHGGRWCDDCVGRTGERVTWCARCRASFDSVPGHQCDVRHPSRSADCQTPGRQRVNSVTENRKPEEDGPEDVSAFRLDADGDDRGCKAEPPPPPPATSARAKDVTWNTLVGRESPDEDGSRLPLSSDDTAAAAAESGKFHRRERNAPTTKFHQNAARDGAASVPPSRSSTTGDGGDSRAAEVVVVGDVVSGRHSADSCVASRLLSSTAMNALLQHIGLECVNKFNRSLLRRRRSSDSEEAVVVQPDCESELERDEGRPSVESDDAERSAAADERDCVATQTHGGSECRRLTECFYCLQRFADVDELQSHFQRAHCRQLSPPVAAFHSPPPDQHGVDSSETHAASTISGPNTSGPSASGLTTSGLTNSGWTTSGPTTSDLATSGQSTSGPSTSGLATSGLTIFGPTTSGPTTSGPSTSDLTSSGPGTSGPSASGLTTSGLTISGPTTSGSMTSGRGVLWDGAGSSSYLDLVGGGSGGLFSGVPLELLLPPSVYPAAAAAAAAAAGGVLPPSPAAAAAMLMMMLSSPFVGPGCPAGTGSLPDPGLLPPGPAAAEPATVADDAAAQQQSRRARTRISESQLAVLRARFDINSPPGDQQIDEIGAEVGLPAKVCTSAVLQPINQSINHLFIRQLTNRDR